MKTVTQTSSKRRHRDLLIALALCCAGLSPTALAGSPTTVVGEDRGKNNSAAEGIETLNINTTGQNNTAHGWFSLSANTQGSDNTANGFEALFNNTVGRSNTANGTYALFSSTTGIENTATGASALQSNTTANGNTATGASALKDNTQGFQNTANGKSALQNNTTGSNNTANGVNALLANTTGTYNTATGFQALLSNTTGGSNTATGVSALGLNTTGRLNTAYGLEALGHNTNGISNTAVGHQALTANTTGYDNTAVGYQALDSNAAGTNNIAVGKWAGVGVTTASNVICIGHQGTENLSDSCYIGQIWNRTVSGGTPVFINNAGRLGTSTSSRRFKHHIKPMKDASEALFALNPVSFRYKSEIDPQEIPQFGLIAEEVEKVNPDLVVRDEEGKVNTVRYEQINAMLLNEFLKEHKKVEAQQATIAELKKGMAVLTAQFKEQSAQLEKVSVQVGMGKPALRVVTNR